MSMRPFLVLFGWMMACRVETCSSLQDSYPAINGVNVISQGRKLIGRFFTPMLKGTEISTPGVLLLHGLPGNDLHYELACKLQGAGFCCLLLHYSGTWGSEGAARLEHTYQDVEAGIRWLCSQQIVDRNQILVVGHCLGGYHSLKLAIDNVKRDCTLLGVVAMSPLLPTSKGITWPPKVLEADCEFLNSYISSSLAVEWSTLAPLTSFIKENLDKTRQVPVLVVTGDADEVHGPQHYKMQLTEIAMRANFSNVEWIRMERANHQLSHQRKESSQVVTDFCCKLSTCQYRIKPAILRAIDSLKDALFDPVSIIFIINFVFSFQSGRFMSTPEGRNYVKHLMDKEVQKFKYDEKAASGHWG